jgi:hypothetical protein
MILIHSLLFLTLASGAHAATEPDILSRCRQECPDAKVNLDAFTCTERLEHEKAKGFLESPCHQAHLAYEAYLTGKVQEKSAKTPLKGRVRVPITITPEGYRPLEVAVPAGKPLVLVIQNKFGRKEEFESMDLDIIDYKIPTGKATELPIGPLQPGQYEYSGDEVSGAKLIAK